MSSHPEEGQAVVHSGMGGQVLRKPPGHQQGGRFLESHPPEAFDCRCTSRVAFFDGYQLRVRQGRGGKPLRVGSGE